ncbi:OsmC family peroxiredoxin [Duganella aceris]|uniref:OsmC family peroxiredoxin n=1 Tax=Duganella aceris TaxID=2703883 RepID=A0ABX0FP05_9BURK|nr:OsmC family peroxiredoxin [Duganella aceris]NGZ86343.1 OsmC family peroxiredoxin [Duganella aceris]
MQAKGYSTWRGNWRQGAGTISTASDSVRDQPYSYASRFDGAPGASPEELLAAAHAGCFNQALANNFGMQSLMAGSIATSVTIELGQDELGRPAILGSHISVEAEVPGATPEQMLQCATRASTNCSISKIMRCDITLAARLLP